MVDAAHRDAELTLSRLRRASARRQLSFQRSHNDDVIVIDMSMASYSSRILRVLAVAIVVLGRVPSASGESDSASQNSTTTHLVHNVLFGQKRVSRACAKRA